MNVLSYLVSSAFKIHPEFTTSYHFHCYYFVQVMIIPRIDDDNILLINLPLWFYACLPKVYFQLINQSETLMMSIHFAPFFKTIQSHPIRQIRNTVLIRTSNAYLPLWSDLLQICPFLTSLHVYRSTCCFLNKPGLLSPLHFNLYSLFHLPEMLFFLIGNNLFQNTFFNPFSNIIPSVSPSLAIVSEVATSSRATTVSRLIFCFVSLKLIGFEYVKVILLILFIVCFHF